MYYVSPSPCCLLGFVFNNWLSTLDHRHSTGSLCSPAPQSNWWRLGNEPSIVIPALSFSATLKISPPENVRFFFQAKNLTKPHKTSQNDFRFRLLLYFRPKKSRK